MAKETWRKCKTPYCRRPAAKARRICETCKSRVFTEKNPIKRLWYHLKKSAKKRHIYFGVGYGEFEAWIIKEKYLERKRGRSKEAVSIDRRKNDPSIGYVLWNMQILTKNENINKYWKTEWGRQEPIEDAPF